MKLKTVYKVILRYRQHAYLFPFFVSENNIDVDKIIKYITYLNVHTKVQKVKMWNRFSFKFKHFFNNDENNKKSKLIFFSVFDKSCCIWQVSKIQDHVDQYSILFDFDHMLGFYTDVVRTLSEICNPLLVFQENLVCGQTVEISPKGS